MDTWKFYDITHREHVVCNPTNEEKLARLVELLRLPANAQVVDSACGKGEFLIRLAEAYDACGVGIDVSPFFIADADRRLETRAPNARITFAQMNGGDFKPGEPHSIGVRARGLREPRFECRSRRAAGSGARSHHREQQG